MHQSFQVSWGVRSQLYSIFERLFLWKLRYPVLPELPSKRVGQVIFLSVPLAPSLMLSCYTHKMVHLSQSLLLKPPVLRQEYLSTITDTDPVIQLPHHSSPPLHQPTPVYFFHF